MQRHALAVPRLTRGTHRKARGTGGSSPKLSKDGSIVTSNYCFKSRHAQERETSPRGSACIPGRTTAQASYHVPQKGKRVQVSHAGDRLLLDFFKTYNISSKDAVSLHYRAEVDAGTLDGDPPALSPDDVSKLDTYKLATYPSRTQSSTALRFARPPASSAQLYQRLLEMINGPLNKTHPSPVVPWLSLLRYHDTFSMHNSAKTYNLLIEHAIRHTLLGPASRLVLHMRARGIQMNLESHKLEIRTLVRSGRWNDAWRQCFNPMGQSYLWARQYPLVFWLEFYAFTSPAIRPWGRARFWKISRRPDVQSNTLHLLLQRIPELCNIGFNAADSRLVGSLVYHLVRIDERVHALNIARTFLAGLPAKLPEKINRDAINIVNLFATFRAKRPHTFHKQDVHTHDTLLDTVYSLLALHGALRPGPSTLVLLMRSLERRPEGAKRAAALLLSARKRWGTRVEDSSVRRAIARLALNTDNQAIAFTMLRRQTHAAWHANANKPFVDLLFNDAAPQPKRQRRMPWLLTHRGIGQENDKWGVLKNAMEKKWGKSWFARRLATDSAKRRQAEATA